MLLSVKNGTEVDDKVDKGDAGLLVVAGIRFDVGEPAVGCAPPLVELELLGACVLDKVEGLEEDIVGKPRISVVLVLGPPEALGILPPWLVRLDVVPKLEDTIGDEAVDCAVVEELVLGELWTVDAGSAAPGDSKLPVGIELVDVCLNEDAVVLVVLTIDDVEETGT